MQLKFKTLDSIGIILKIKSTSFLGFFNETSPMYRFIGDDINISHDDSSLWDDLEPEHTQKKMKLFLRGDTSSYNNMRMNSDIFSLQIEVLNHDQMNVNNNEWIDIHFESDYIVTFFNWMMVVFSSRMNNNKQYIGEKDNKLDNDACIKILQMIKYFDLNIYVNE